MAYPPAYTRTFSFTDWETLHPGEPKPGDKLDTEYDAVSNALTGTQNALALIQRADGALANDSVGPDQLQDGLFDDIADGITDDAQAAADAAAASASLAATHAANADASANAAVTAANEADGAAAQAGVSQGIAQQAANDAQNFRDGADDANTSAAAHANEAQGSAAAATLSEDTAFDWAEKLEGPVFPAPPGWPEAVDDGMFSSKWWAIRARDYNTVTQLDFGTAGADIGEAFDIWDAIDGNELPLGQVFASWGTPTHTFALTDPANPSDPDSWTDTTGGPGPPGPANTLTIGTVASGIPSAATITGTSPNQVLNLTLEPGPTGATGATGAQGIQGVPGPANTLNIGTVTTGAPGSAAAADITGAAPNQTLSLTIPRGDVGATGAPGLDGPPNTLAIGTVTTGAPGSAASATITGTSPNQILNMTIPRGDVGPQGIQGIQGPVGPAVNLADPTGTIGLTAVAGVATTAPRSDSSPALSQAISPTWTQQHKFTGPANDFPIKVTGSGANPYGMLIDAGDGSAAAALWVRRSDVGNRNLLVVQGNQITFGNATDNPPYTFLGTGLATFGGTVNVNGVLNVVGAGGSQTGFFSNFYYQKHGGAPLDAKTWAFTTNSSGSFSIGPLNDAGSGSNGLLSATRTGVAITAVTFGNAVDNPPYTFAGTGITTHNGAVTAPSYTVSSSRTVKRETGKPAGVRDILSRLRPVLYRLLAGNDNEQLGLIAEEVHEVCPLLSDGKSVMYDRLALLLLADWQESHAAARAVNA